MGDRGLHINEVVNLRKRLFALEAPTLAAKYPMLSEEMTRGMTLGDEPNESFAYVKATALFAADTLDKLVPLCETAIEECEKRLRREARLRLYSHLISIVGTSSIVASLSFSQTQVALITSLLTLAAGSIVAVADFVSAVPGSQIGNVQQAHETLTSALISAQIASRELRCMCEFYTADLKLSEKVTAANEMARSMYKNSLLMNVLERRKQQVAVLGGV
jgi:hypothetical protein